MSRKVVFHDGEQRIVETVAHRHVGVLKLPGNHHFVTLFEVNDEFFFDELDLFQNGLNISTIALLPPDTNKLLQKLDLLELAVLIDLIVFYRDVVLRWDVLIHSVIMYLDISKDIIALVVLLQVFQPLVYLIEYSLHVLATIFLAGTAGG